jgi:hypothetical protein
MPSVKSLYGSKAEIDGAAVRAALAVLVDPGQTFELRGLPGGKSRTCRGDDLDGAVRAAGDLADGTGVYFTLNPCHPGLKGASKVNDILSRRWLLVDVDPEHARDTNSTEAEKLAAGNVACAVLEHLEGLGWPSPVMIDSGNGWHLLYRVDLPNTELARLLLKRVLAALAERFDTDSARVDRAVHNASRISKLPGTWARKGPHSEERPHRLARLMAAPMELGIVATEQLENLARKEEKPLPPQPEKAPDFRGAAANGALDGYVRSAIDKECYRILSATPGAAEGRNNALNRAAHSLGTMAGWPEMVASFARSELLRAALQAGLENRESEKTIESGWTAGADKPRMRPETGHRNGTAHANGKPQERPKLAKYTTGLHEATPKKVDWLWENRIAPGFISIFAGRTGFGKSYAVLDVAARLSRGEAPPFSSIARKMRTLIISEDPVDYMLAPRLIAMRADPSMIRFMTWEAMAQFTLSDTAMLDEVYAECGSPGLLIIDPPSNFLGDTDEHKNSEVRNVLMKLVAWLDGKHVACVLITHINKAVGKGLDAVERIMGSAAFGSVARITLAFAKDTTAPEQFVCGGTKNNLGKKAESLAYRITEKDGAVVLDWIGKSDTDMEDALNKMRSPTKKIEAVQWFIKKFRERLEWPERELQAEYVAMGISRTTYFAARGALGIQSRSVKNAKMQHKYHVLFVPEDWPYLIRDFGDQLDSGDSGTLDNRKSNTGNDLRKSVQSTNANPQSDSGARVPQSQSPTRDPREESDAARNREEINQVFSKPADPPVIPWDGDLESPEKRWERRRFKIGTWLRNLLWGAPAPGAHVLKRATDSGFTEGEIREVAKLIDVDTTGDEWVYRGF